MCLHPASIEPVPETTIRIARAAFPKGNLYLSLRDDLGTFFSDEDFAGLYPKRGQPAFAPWRLALVTIFQFTENLSDRQAADAVRARIDWKYALGLDLTDPGFDHTVLAEFRERLVAGSATECLLNRMLEHFRERKLLKVRGKQRTDSTHVLAAIRTMNRLELLVETMRAALNEVATVAPDWLRTIAAREWFDRYSSRVDDYHLPSSKTARKEYSETVGRDGFALLHALDEQRPDLSALARLGTLRQVWERHFACSDAGEVTLREVEEMSKAAEAIESPYDPEARHSNKHALSWTGYKTHLSETCDEGFPRLITNVHTTVATTQDVSSTMAVHTQLAAKDLLPFRHFVDAGYVAADFLVTSMEEYGVELYGPPRPDQSWQVKEGGNDVSRFAIDWDNERAICPEGKVSVGWGPYLSKPSDDLHVRIRFSTADCTDCPQRSRCVRSPGGQSRSLNVQDRQQHEALQRARQRIETVDGKKEYQNRAGVEGCISQGVRRCDLRQSRYRGLQKTHLQGIAIAASINVVRAVNHLNEVPLRKARPSRFAELAC